MSEGSKRQVSWAPIFLVLGLVAWQFYVAGPDGVADGGTLVRYGARRPSFGFAQPPWRLMASIFLHGHWVHLVANSVVIVLWGGVVARLLGPAGFLLSFVTAGLGGSVASDVWGPEALAVGASGGVAGLVLLTLTLSLVCPTHRAWSVDEARAWRHSSVAAVALNLALASGLGSAGAQLDHWAHSGGAAVGVVLGLLSSADPLLGGRRFWLGVSGLWVALAVLVWYRGPAPF